MISSVKFSEPMTIVGELLDKAALVELAAGWADAVTTAGPHMAPAATMAVAANNLLQRGIASLLVRRRLLDLIGDSPQSGTPELSRPVPFGIWPWLHRPMGLALEKRMLGTSGLEVSALGLGCMGMSYHRSTTMDRDAAIALVRKAVDLGVTFFDTAQVYGPFTNEQLVGDAIAPVRDQVVVATKFGQVDASGQPLLSSRPELVKQTTDASLARLGVETIDLLYQHRVDPDVPIEEVAGAVKELIDAGQGQAFRPVRGRRPDHPPRPRRPAGDRRPERVLAVVATPGGGGAPGLRGAGHRVRAVQPARAEASSPARSTSAPPSTAATTATPCRALRSRRARRTRRSSTCSGGR